MAPYLFNSQIDDWHSWSRVFQSIDLFKGIIDCIHSRHGLDCDDIRLMTPGTNANFWVNNRVLKIYPPKEIGVTGNSCEAIEDEIQALVRAEELKILAPRVLAQGLIRDRYDFSYMILSYIEGREAYKVVPKMSPSEKCSFASTIREICQALHSDFPRDYDEAALRRRAIENHRWKIFPPILRDELARRVANLDLPPGATVHGDLTGDNVIISDHGEVGVIDFGDTQVAPRIYEHPPITLDLFLRDPRMIEEYLQAPPKESFLDDLFKSILIHDFGGDIAAGLCSKALGLPPDEVKSLKTLEQALTEFLSIHL